MRKQGVSAAAWLVAGLVAAGAGGGPRQAAGQSATPNSPWNNVVGGLTPVEGARI